MEEDGLLEVVFLDEIFGLLDGLMDIDPIKEGLISFFQKLLGIASFVDGPGEDEGCVFPG